jgi:predicted ATPase
MFGYPDAALADVDQALKDAREIGHAATLLFALAATSLTHILCGNHAEANIQSDEAVALADEKGLSAWKGWGMMNEGCVSALTNKSSDAVRTMAAGISTWRSTGGTILLPLYLSNLAMAYADLGRYDDAWRSIGEAIKAIDTTKETWCEAEVNRIVGAIALKCAEPDAAKAQRYFERALAIARSQEAKSWELRAAMSMARLKRDQGKPDEARNLLAPVFGWFTEGFDTLDLKEAKALLDELAL